MHERTHSQAPSLLRDHFLSGAPLSPPPICCRRPAWCGRRAIVITSGDSAAVTSEADSSLGPAWGWLSWVVLRCFIQSISRVHPSITAWTAARLQSPPLTVSGACSDACPSRRRCHPAILSSVAPSSGPQHQNLLLMGGTRHRPIGCFWGSRAAACAGVGAVLLPSVTCAQNRACFLQSRQSSRADAAYPGTRPCSAAHTHG